MTQANYKESSIQLSISLIFILALFPSIFKSIIIALFSIVFLYQIYRFKLKFDWKYFVLNSIIYLLLVISLIYSDDKEFALKKLETMASLLVFPFLFSFFTEKSNLLIPLKGYQSFLLYYIFAILLLNFVFFFIFWIGEFSFLDTLYHFPYLINEKLEGYNIHAIYMSMHICVAIIFILFLLMQKNVTKLVPLLIFGLIFLLMFLLILNKKGPILALIVVVTLYVFSKGTYWHKFSLTISLVFITLLIFINPKSRNQFGELININNIKNSEINSTNLRFAIYQNAVDCFLEKPLLGYGIGDSHNALLNVYKKDSETLYEGQYNTHNQYLSFLLSVGMIGTLIILYSFYLLYQKAMKKSNYLFLSVFGFYLFVMLFENILQRENGVIFYSFFICFLQIVNFQDEKL